MVNSFGTPSWVVIFKREEGSRTSYYPESFAKWLFRYLGAPMRERPSSPGRYEDDEIIPTLNFANRLPEYSTLNGKERGGE